MSGPDNPGLYYGLYYDEPEPGVLREMTLVEFADRWEDPKGRLLAHDELCGGEVTVSTIWLGISHQYGEGPPLIYETMVFYKRSGMSGEYQQRYTYRADALRGHAEAIAWALRNYGPARES